MHRTPTKTAFRFLSNGSYRYALPPTPVLIPIANAKTEAVCGRVRAQGFKKSDSSHVARHFPSSKTTYHRQLTGMLHSDLPAKRI
nr:MAG TPA: hypothetical protein [Caudoviricetes sp.]